MDKPTEQMEAAMADVLHGFRLDWRPYFATPEGESTGWDEQSVKHAMDQMGRYADDADWLLRTYGAFCEQWDTTKPPVWGQWIQYLRHRAEERKTRYQGDRERHDSDRHLPSPSRLKRMKMKIHKVAQGMRPSI